MSGTLRTLLVENSEDDALLLLEALRRDGYEPACTQVQTPAALRAALVAKEWDIILCDYLMPGFDAPAALLIVQELAPELPVIVVSGTVGEDTAVETIKLGATDYLMKDRLMRLGRSVGQALEQKRLRQERRQTDQALQESVAKLHCILSTAPVGLGRVANRVLLEVNEAMGAMLGYRPEELNGQEARRLYPSTEEYDAAGRHYVQLAQQNKVTFETRALRKDGRIIDVSCTAVWLDPTRPEAGVVFAAQDISERRLAEQARARLESQLRQTQKIEAIGTLAGGIAHDFNNILAGISGFNSLARQVAGNNAELLDYLTEIGRAGQRAAELVQQILTFSRAGDQSLAPVELGPIVGEAVKLLRAALPSTIEFDLRVATGLPPVLGNSTQLHQVVMNLGTNAWHAMRDRAGRLSVSLELCTVQSAFANTLPGLTPGLYLRLTVVDTGCGMDSATQERVFEPFFTTKEPGEGTGLGLSVVHGIVRHHRGAIRLSSEPGHGANFEIYLPVCTAALPTEAAVPVGLLRGKGERILFVDDEEPLVWLGEQALRKLGYEVQCERRGADALARLARDPQAFQLVITDQTMPGMTGLEFARKIRELRPDLPVIIASGNSRALSPDKILETGVREVLSKPYTVEKLARTVHQHLSLHFPS